MLFCNLHHSSIPYVFGYVVELFFISSINIAAFIFKIDITIWTFYLKKKFGHDKRHSFSPQSQSSLSSQNSEWLRLCGFIEKCQMFLMWALYSVLDITNIFFWYILLTVEFIFSHLSSLFCSLPPFLPSLSLFHNELEISKHDYEKYSKSFPIPSSP